MPNVTTVTCLFYTRDGSLAVRLLDRPVPDTITDNPVYPGMMHAIRALGMTQPILRSFKRTVDGAIPVFEETT